MIKWVLIFLLIPSACWGGVDLNGDADYIDTNDVTFGAQLDGSSVCGWIKSSQTTIGSFANSVGDGSADRLQIQINANSSETNQTGRLSAQYIDLDEVVLRTGVNNDTGISDGEWHHLCVTYQSTGTSGDIDFWVDGNDETETAGAATGDADNFQNFDYDLLIGARNLRGTPDVFYDAAFSEFCLFTKVLSSNEIAFLSKAKVRGMCNQIGSLHAYYPLDDFSDGSALDTNAGGYKDRSGNGLNAQGVDADGDSTNIAGQVLSYP